MKTLKKILLLTGIAMSINAIGQTITIDYFGQACFRVTSANGTTVLIDPAEFKGYHLPGGLAPDIVTISHNHFDHNQTAGLKGNPVILRGTTDDLQRVNPIATVIGDIRFSSIASYHNPAKTAKNAIFLFDMDGIRLAHLGDLGMVLTGEQIKAMGDVDLLMIPVGGKYTLDPAGADTVIGQLPSCRIIIPMHYRTEAFDGLPYTVDDFLQGKQHVRRINGNRFSFSPADIPQTMETVVLKYQ